MITVNDNVTEVVTRRLKFEAAEFKHYGFDLLHWHLEIDSMDVVAIVGCYVRVPSVDAEYVSCTQNVSQGDPRVNVSALMDKLWELIDSKVSQLGAEVAATGRWYKEHITRVV